jgi:hypothetical protein
MDITTVFALIAVIIGPIALYFLRRGNVRSNGVFEGVDTVNHVRFGYSNDDGDDDWWWWSRDDD